LKVAVSEFCNEEDRALILALTDPPDGVEVVDVVAALGELEHAARTVPSTVSPTSRGARFATRRREVDVDVMGGTPALVRSR
jgi:hypothetical protein